MGYDKGLYKEIRNKVGDDNVEISSSQEFYMPTGAIKPHIHFYSDGCELRYKTGSGIKLVYNSNQKNQANLDDAKLLGGNIELAAKVIEEYY